MDQMLFWPMLTYALWMGLIAFYMMFTRLRAVKRREIPVKYFKLYQGFTPSEKSLALGRHYDNQFQLPLLYFLTCLTALALNRVSETTLVLAWLFVFSRLGHSFIHLGSNHVLYRLITFASGWIVVILLWLDLAQKGI